MSKDDIGARCIGCKSENVRRELFGWSCMNCGAIFGDVWVEDLDAECVGADEGHGDESETWLESFVRRVDSHEQGSPNDRSDSALRKGQYAYNVLRDEKPGLAEAIKRLGLDPFYDNGMVPNLFGWLREGFLLVDNYHSLCREGLLDEEQQSVIAECFAEVGFGDEIQR